MSASVLESLTMICAYYRGGIDALAIYGRFASPGLARAVGQVVVICERNSKRERRNSKRERPLPDAHARQHRTRPAFGGQFPRDPGPSMAPARLGALPQLADSCCAARSNSLRRIARCLRASVRSRIDHGEESDHERTPLPGAHLPANERPVSRSITILMASSGKSSSRNTTSAVIFGYQPSNIGRCTSMSQPMGPLSPTIQYTTRPIDDRRYMLANAAHTGWVPFSKTLAMHPFYL